MGGDRGAANLAQLLAERGVELDFVLDEGGNIMTDGFPPLTNAPVALVATAEKVPSQLSANTPASSSLPSSFSVLRNPLNARRFCPNHTTDRDVEMTSPMTHKLPLFVDVILHSRR